MAPGGDIERATAEFLEAFEALKQASADFGTLARDNELEQADRDFGEFADTWLWREPAFLEQLGDAARFIAASRRQLQAWCAWRQRRKEVIDADLEPLVGAIETDRFRSPRSKNFLGGLLRLVVGGRHYGRCGAARLLQTGA